MPVMPLSITDRNPYGVYQVGSGLYPNKLDAAFNATQQKLPITWNFHDSAFSKLNWQQRPTGTLKDLYRQRAQQLRDTYDYIIVYFSGGSDSWTVLHSFLSNNIHIDEIRTNWAMANRKYYQADPTNHNEINIMSEFEYSVLPVLEHVKKHYPKTSIVINDYSDAIQQRDFKEEFVFLSNHWQNISSPFRPQCSSDKSSLLLKRHRSVAAVYGFEKIKLRNVNKNLYMYFSDTAGGAEVESEKTVEFFFSTPDFPLISVMQAHYLKDELIAQKHSLVKAGATHISGVRERGDWHQIYLKACYPDYNPDTFQTNKALGTLVRASDVWILRHNPTFFKSWRWTYTQYFKNLDQKLVTTALGNLITGLHYTASQSYLIDNNFDFPDFDVTRISHPPLVTDKNNKLVY
jgi:hypothetical protein